MEIVKIPSLGRVTAYHQGSIMAALRAALGVSRAGMSGISARCNTLSIGTPQPRDGTLPLERVIRPEAQSLLKEIQN